MSGTETLIPQEMDAVIEENSRVSVPGVGIVNADFLKIDENNISDALDKQAGYYAFWSVAVADAERDAAQANLNAKVVAAEVHRELKEDNKKMTVPDLKMAVDEDPRVVAARMTAIDEEYRSSLCKAMMYALQQKKDMLSSKTGLRRTELEVHMKEIGQKVLTGGKYGEE